MKKIYKQKTINNRRKESHLPLTTFPSYIPKQHWLPDGSGTEAKAEVQRTAGTEADSSTKSDSP